jgi:hypothetical protein
LGLVAYYRIYSQGVCNAMQTNAIYIQLTSLYEIRPLLIGNRHG